jgi:hypothetical protein
MKKIVKTIAKILGSTALEMGISLGILFCIGEYYKKKEAKQKRQNEETVEADFNIDF